VKRGDSLAKIASKHRVSIRSLKSKNSLKSHRIFPGQVLKIPKGKGLLNKYYRVRRGDNLTSISKKFNLSVRKIKSRNNIPGTRIYPGQLLRVVF